MFFCVFEFIFIGIAFETKWHCDCGNLFRISRSSHLHRSLSRETFMMLSGSLDISSEVRTFTLQWLFPPSNNMWLMQPPFPHKWKWKRKEREKRKKEITSTWRSYLVSFKWSASANPTCSKMVCYCLVEMHIGIGFAGSLATHVGYSPCFSPTAAQVARFILQVSEMGKFAAGLFISPLPSLFNNSFSSPSITEILSL